MNKLLFLLFFVAAISVAAQQPNITLVGTVFPQRQTPVHDPVMIKESDIYCIFSTGTGINVYSSKDTKNWTKEKPIFDPAPA